MAHYAFLDNAGIVTEVIVGKDETEIIDGLTPEEWYAQFRGQTCVRTSYNSKIRGTFAGQGFSYNHEEDIFIAPQPYPSWIRNGSFWKAPIAEPTDGRYSWNEEDQSWDSNDESA